MAFFSRFVKYFMMFKKMTLFFTNLTASKMFRGTKNASKKGRHIRGNFVVAQKALAEQTRPTSSIVR